MSMFLFPELTLVELKSSAKDFVTKLQKEAIPDLFGVTDGKAVGTYVEQMFRRYLGDRYAFIPGNSASGIDLPGLAVDIKATSIKQPQSSCPFRSASQKVYGLGYHLLVFVYEKVDDPLARAAKLVIKHIIFIEKERTADWQTTRGITEILQRDGNKDDIVAFLEDRNFPLDDVGREALAEQILNNPPEIGYLTTSRALQPQSPYSKAISAAIPSAAGVENLLV